MSRGKTVRHNQAGALGGTELTTQLGGAPLGAACSGLTVGLHALFWAPQALGERHRGELNRSVGGKCGEAGKFVSSWTPWASLLAGTLCLHRSPCSGLLSAGDRQTHSWPATDTLPPGRRVSPEEWLGEVHPAPSIPSAEDKRQRLAHPLGGSP